MSSRGSKPTRPKPGGASGDDDPRALMDDLESLRSVLSDDQTGVEPPADDTSDADVPVLEDVVGGGFKVEEAPLLGRPGRAAPKSDHAHVLAEDTIKMLLGDEWRTSADTILKQTRQRITESRAQWTPGDTDDLNQALKTRIDATVSSWIRATIARHIHELRQALLEALDQEMSHTLTDRLDAGDDKPADHRQRPAAKPKRATDG